MRLLTIPVFLLAAAVSDAPACAQTLSATLAQEDAALLGLAAQEKGDAVRGAILFSQKKLNCSGCHQPRAADLLGPDLSQLGPDVDAEHFVQSILQPSKVIKQGFESVKVLTVDGRLLVGRIVRELPDEILLRDTSATSRLIRLPRSEVEQISANNVSTMPADLADQLADRQQFLDLVKYLMDIAATGQQVASTNAIGGGEVGSRLKGLALIDAFRCGSCHPGNTASALPAARAPDLSLAASRIDPDYIRRFIADPLHVKPGTSMPDVMGPLDDKARDAAATAIQAYLLSLVDAPFDRQASDPDASARGKELFHSVGCVACHSPRGDDGQELLADDSVPLGRLTAKYSIAGLASFLEHPHQVRPSGRMPDMSLTHWEAIALANYLLEDDEPQSSPPRPHLEASLVQAGRTAYRQLGCANCHEPDKAEADNLAADEVAADEVAVGRQSIPLAQLNPERGCLSGDPHRSIHFAFSQSQQSQLVSALNALSEPLDDREQIQLTMHTLRCFSCHQRGELGGVSDARDLYFHSENENLGPQGRIPPTLTDVGAKLNAKWMRQVLVSGRTIRPYVQTRMPQYGTENVVHLVDLFARTDKLADIPFAHPPDTEEAKKIGTELVGRGGLNCVACHTFQQKPAQTMPAVDLTEMAERLQRPWFEHYMRRPQSLSPGTVMPSFWPGGKAIRKEILDGNSDQQIAAIWEYLLDGRQARTPQGLDIEPIELVAAEEAVMLRRNYQGIGKRGIGVGFPGEVNLAFDAEQMRLGMIWRGKFADPGAAWRGQGAGHVRPLSRNVLQFPSGPELDDAKNPWVVDQGRPPKHAFGGYLLDELQRPTWTYRFGDIEVQDKMVNSDMADGSVGFKRTVTLLTSAPRERLAFRLGSGESIRQIDERTFRLDDALQITIDQHHRAEIIRDAETQRLVIPLSLDAGLTELVIEYSW